MLVQCLQVGKVDKMTKLTHRELATIRATLLIDRYSYNEERMKELERIADKLLKMMNEGR
jgi:hypothetical protein